LALREYGLGNLNDTLLRDLMARWGRDCYGVFRNLCKDVFEELTAPAELPLANWYELLARRAKTCVVKLHRLNAKVWADGTPRLGQRKPRGPSDPALMLEYLRGRRVDGEKGEADALVGRPVGSSECIEMQWEGVSHELTPHRARSLGSSGIHQIRKGGPTWLLETASAGTSQP
jgi:hypothetical protein